MKTSKKVLLTFIGNRDPFNVTANTKSDGPVLSLLNQWEKTKELTGIYLFHTSTMDVKAGETQEILTATFPHIEVGVCSIATEDPTDYQALLGGLRQNISDLQKKLCEDVEFWIAASPGTPQMQTCWFLLAASREISASVLQVRDTKDALKGQSLITEIDPQATWFPIIYSPIRDAARKRGGTLSKKTPNKKAAIENLHIIGSSTSLQESIDKAAKAAATESGVIIFGESGTGKESLARLIHDLSCRSDKPFRTVNCGIFTDTLMESELFGHERGAFTGATDRKQGVFETADGGTLFLDEVGELSQRAQISLLRVLQEHRFRRVGGAEDIKVDVRVIAATNRNLQDDVKKGRFREDLYYRLMVLPITMSPLRERRKDIGLLVDYFRKQFDANKNISKEAVKKLETYHWPGNIRELRNFIERIVVMSDEDEIGANQINLSSFENHATQEMNLPELPEGFRLDKHCHEYRAALIKKALNHSRTKREAAKLLGVSAAALSKRKKRA